MKRLYVSGMAVLLSAAVSFNGMAAGWYQDGNIWKYQSSDNQNLTKGWYWLDGNKDGIAECYYFDQNGNMLVSSQTPDGFLVDETGAWIVDGVRQTKRTGISFGAWEQRDAGWKFKQPDGTYAANGWYWIDGNGDGIAECYYFDGAGEMLSGQNTPDGYRVNEDGAWTENGRVVKRYSDGRGTIAEQMASSSGRSGSSSGSGGGGSHAKPDPVPTPDPDPTPTPDPDPTPTPDPDPTPTPDPDPAPDQDPDPTPTPDPDPAPDPDPDPTPTPDPDPAPDPDPDPTPDPDPDPTPDPDPAEDGVVLYSEEQGAAPILMDAGYRASEEDAYAERTYGQILRAVGDLRQDIAMVTGAVDDYEIQQIFVDNEEKQAERLEAANEDMVPQIVYDNVAEGTTYQNAIIVGAIGNSPLIDQMIEDGKLDEAKDIEDSWEGYVLKEVDDPVDGVDHALVIAGSDARGTIYGIYTLSEEIGVSPFYWYSDVPVEVQDTVEVDYSEPVVDDGPAVKYRGIFINDEDISILKWAAKKFPTENGTPDVNYYRKAYELMLRLKCNLLWPAMHEVSQSFNVALDEDGIPINSKEASKYGIVVGSTHCDILLRTNTGEWWPWLWENQEKYNLDPNNWYREYDFTTHREAIIEYWRERLETNKDFESVLTLGIRGVHDGAFNCARLNEYPGSTDAERKVKFMEDVIKTQRELIAEVYFDGDMSRVSEIPQVLIPYKEMATVYNDGLDEFLAQPEYEDITLMWAEDNHGYVRQTPNETEKERSGGAGIYYHASYYGSPTDYLWLNSIPLSLMSEQMHRVYDENMQNQWILNVGDIKPGDQSTEYFMKIAWDPEQYDDTAIPEYLKAQAQRDWCVSEDEAETIAAALKEYYQMTGTKKPEYYNRADYTLSPTANGDEALLWAERSQWVVDQLTPIYESLDEDLKTAFYEQIYYHVLSANDAAKEYAYYWKAVQASSQGRVGSTGVYVDMSKEYRDNILNRVDDYNGMHDDKWNGYMSWKHVTGSEDGNHDILKNNEYPNVPAAKTGAGAAAEGQAQAGSGTLRLNSLIEEDQRYFDVFAMESNAVEWIAEAPEWVKLSQSAGSTSTEQRVIVTVDWDMLDESQTGTIQIFNAKDGQKLSEDVVAEFTVEAVKSEADFDGKDGFIEANGYVVVEAEHYSEMEEGGDGSSWGSIQSNAQHGDTMKAYPDHDASDGDGAKLIYDVYFDKAGTYNGVLKRLPTLNESLNSCKVGIRVNDGGIQVLSGNSTWENYWPWAYNVQRMYEPLSFTAAVEQGWNTIEIIRIDPSIVIDRFEIETKEGGLAESLLGPVESPNNIAEGEERQIVKIAALPEELGSYVSYPGMELTQGEETKAYEGYTGQDVITEAASGEPRVAEVSVEDGKIYVTPDRAGAAEVQAKTSDGTVFSFKVTVNPKAGNGAYQEENGLIVIDACSALEESEYAYHTEPEDIAWTLDGVGVQALPDTGTNWLDTNYSALEKSAPGLHYQINISDGGTYYLYVNTSNPDVAADSYHVAVDGTYQYADKSEQAGTETWYSLKQGIKLEEGLHTLTIFAREDGFKINQLALSAKKDESFKGLQEASSRTTVEGKGTISMEALEDLTLVLGDYEEEEIIVTASASNAEPITYDAEADDVDVADIEEQDEPGTFLVRALGAGITRITITASAEGCKSAKETFVVTVKEETQEDGLYYPENGKGEIVINAVDALLNTEYASCSNESEKYPNTEFKWTYVKEDDHSSLQLTPVSEVNGKDGDGKWVWTDTANVEQAPAVEFQVYVEEEGNYYWSFFANSPNLATDSYHLVVNGEYQYQTGDKNMGAGDAAKAGWYTCKKTLPLEVGENTISIYARESGLLLRQLMISKNKPSGLSGWQTACEAAGPEELQTDLEEVILDADQMNLNKPLDGSGITEAENANTEKTEQETADPAENLSDPETSDKNESDEEASDAEESDEKDPDKETSDEEISDEEISDEEISDEEISDEEISGEEISDEEISDEEISDEEASDEETSDEEISDEESSDTVKPDVEAPDKEVSDAEDSDTENSDSENSDEEAPDKETTDTEVSDIEEKDAAEEENDAEEDSDTAEEAAKPDQEEQI